MITASQLKSVKKARLPIWVNRVISSVARPLSGLPQSTDIAPLTRHVGKVPIAEIADAIRSEKICSTNRGLDVACWIIPLYLGLFMQNDAQQRFVLGNCVTK